MANISVTAYIINNNLCVTGMQQYVDCNKVTAQDTSYFVLVNNEFPDGCGGFLEAGTEITEIQTLGHETDTWINLLHVIGNGNDLWIDSTKQEFTDACVCCTGSPNSTKVETIPSQSFTAGIPNTFNTSAVFSGVPIIQVFSIPDQQTISLTYNPTPNSNTFTLTSGIDLTDTDLIITVSYLIA